MFRRTPTPSAPAAPHGRGRAWQRAVALVAVALTSASLVTLAPTRAGAVSTGPTTHLKAVGPVSGDNGFPVWYKDADGTSATLCNDPANALCAIPVGAVPNPTAPVVFPSNYPNEAFYALATSTLSLPSGTATMTGGLEAAFSNRNVVQGDQIVFGRVRIRVDTPGPGHYTVTHPYGVDEFDVVAGGSRAINFTEDIGLTPGNFTTALNSRVNPFLRWDTGYVKDADGSSYFGDPATPHKVTGSALNTNYFQIAGPGIGGPGVDVVKSDLFAVQGKVATSAGVAPTSMTYSRADTTGGMIDAFGASQPDQTIQVSGSGVATTTLRGDPDGHYFGRVPFTGDVPTVKLSNSSDRPRTDVPVVLTDRVTVRSATYDADAGTLTVTAASSDTAGGGPTLSVLGYGDLTGGTFAGPVRVPPATVTVTSARGGSAGAPVVASGSGLAPDPVVAQAGPDLTVQQGQKVLLDGGGSLNATSYAWTQTSGSAVALTGADTGVASFTAPTTGGPLGFRLLVGGPTVPGSQTTDDVTVTVAAVAPPTANAGSPQTVLQGSTVTLDGSSSQGATSYAWKQTGGLAVTLSGATTSKPTFTMPQTNDPLLFQLTITGPGGSDVASVQVNPTPDVLTVGTAEYRKGKGSWKVTGTAAVTTTNTVTVWIGQTGAAPAVKLGTATVDALGGWSLALAKGPVPDSSGTVSVTSSRGGALLAVPVFIRN